MGILKYIIYSLLDPILFHKEFKAVKKKKLLKMYTFILAIYSNNKSASKTKKLLKPIY